MDNLNQEQQNVQMNGAWTNPVEEEQKEKVVLGILGAFLFSLAGIAMYFAVYQLNIIAGVSGLIMFLLASKGYELFAGMKKKVSVTEIITAIVMTVIMIFAAECICIVYEVYKMFAEEGMNLSLSSTLKYMPMFLEDPEMIKSIAGDLLFAYIFSVLSIVQKVRELKK